MKEKTETLPDSEKLLLEKYDKIALERHELSKKIDDLSQKLGNDYALVFKKGQAGRLPLDQKIIDQSSANDKLIGRYYKLSSTMVEIENKLREISDNTTVPAQ